MPPYRQTFPSTGLLALTQSSWGLATVRVCCWTAFPHSSSSFQFLLRYLVFVVGACLAEDFSHCLLHTKLYILPLWGTLEKSPQALSSSQYFTVACWWVYSSGEDGEYSLSWRSFRLRQARVSRSPKCAHGSGFANCPAVVVCSATISLLLLRYRGCYSVVPFLSVKDFASAMTETSVSLPLSLSLDIGLWGRKGKKSMWGEVVLLFCFVLFSHSSSSCSSPKA